MIYIHGLRWFVAALASSAWLALIFVLLDVTDVYEKYISARLGADIREWVSANSDTLKLVILLLALAWAVRVAFFETQAKVRLQPRLQIGIQTPNAPPDGVEGALIGRVTCRTEAKKNRLVNTTNRPHTLRFQTLNSQIVRRQSLPLEMSCGTGTITVTEFTDKGFRIREKDTRGAEILVEIYYA